MPSATWESEYPAVAQNSAERNTRPRALSYFPPHRTCAEALENPNNNQTSFDNLLTAFLVIFQCSTLEGWTTLM